MKFAFNFPCTNIENAYLSIHHTYSRSFIKTLITIVAGSIAFTIFQYQWPEGIYDLIKMLGVLIVCFLVWKSGSKTIAYKNIILTILSLGLLINETFGLKRLMDPGLDSNSILYAGYALGSFERTIIRQISCLENKLIFLILSTIARVLILPFNNNIIVFYYWAWWGITLLAEVWREQDSRLLFKSFFKTKEELAKFKDLMVSSIPTNILILSHDLKEKLFFNEHFQTTFNIPKDTSAADWSADEWLSSFYIEKESLNASSKDALGDINQPLNMLQVFQELIKKHLLSDLNHQYCFNVQNEQTSSVSNSRKIFETRIFSLPWDGKSAVAVILNDVTQQFTNMALRVASSNKDKMIAMVSHELRTPLNCILGMISIMEKQIKDPEILGYLMVCKNNSKLLVSLVNSILDLGQIRNNKLKLAISRGNLQEILQEIFLLFEIQFKAKGLYLLFDIGSGVDEWIVTDLNRFRQIMINLIGNALKFTSHGGVRVLVNKCQTREGFLTFAICDTGKGIKEEDKGKLFKMYGRVDHSDPALNSDGVGLGLTISNHLVKLLADSEEETCIEVESEYERGSKFSFSIKAELRQFAKTEPEYDLCETEGREHSRATDDSQEFANRVSSYMLKPTNSMLINSFSTNKRLINPVLARNPSLRVRSSVSSFFSVKADVSQEISSPLSPFSSRYSPENSRFLKKDVCRGKVLLVDDSPFNLMVAKHLIESLGYQVETVLNGEEAVNIVKKLDSKNEPFRIIFMDCQMPIMNGYEATRIIRRMVLNGEIADVPIVALSANDTEKDKKMCKEAGMCEHLAKPLNEEKLQEVMRKFCKKRRKKGSSFKIQKLTEDNV